ncbi:monooxygenase [Lysinibacillus sp. 54212]|uniref:monooxygenase n=1 Tax=Lysinibacillus sp. 54212 TaxID=3119829 RepID=UPI002FC8769C
MAFILQVDFPMDGPFGDDLSHSFAELANSINEEPGMVWKIWTENAEAKEAGGIYLFQTKEDAVAYLEMHTARLNSFGTKNIRGKIFAINEALTKINNGPVT